MALSKKKEVIEDPAELVARKDYKKAIAIYRERVSKQPKNATLRLALADTMLLANMQDEAIREYKETGALYTEDGFLVKAIAIYKKILKLRPGDRDVETFLEHLSDRRGLDVPKGKPPAAAPAPAQSASPPAASAVAARPPAAAPVQTPPPSPPQAPVRPPSVEIETMLFRDLSPDEFREIVARLALRHFEEDTIIVKEGDPGDSLFIVVRGQVRVITHDVRQNEIELADLGEGEFFGEISLLTGRPRTATIITNLDTELLELTRTDYERVVAQYPNVKIVMEEFHQKRAYKTVEAMIQAMRGPS
jgi:tetratricopeptide (TPR) repeat protein